MRGFSSFATPSLAVFALCICLRLSAQLQGDDSRLNYRQDESFLSWCAEFCELESDEYLSRIYPTWKQNADYVAEQNSLGLPYSLALNKFAHLSREEFSKRHFQAEHFPRSDKFSSTTANTRDPPPPSVDWRTKGVVPPVSNQGVCGDAVGFAVVHSVDSLNAIKTGKLLLASVEEYFDCCTDGSCDGGLYGGASYSCIVDIGGLALESVYVSPDHKCLNDTFPAAIKINGGRFVAPSGDETELAYAVAMQPVVAAVDASHSSFQLYASGVYYDPDCSTHNLDHTVLIVGYGVMENGVEYWICQNSWGTTWGMEGYILMARNRDNNCGIATNASYPY